MIGTLKASDVYMDMLRALPNEDKLDLISELVKSMKKAVGIKKEPKDIFARFSSDWGGDMPTEDYADMLRSENVENTRTVVWLNIYLTPASAYPCSGMRDASARLC